jgi:hypothetical protein
LTGLSKSASGKPLIGSRQHTRQHILNDLDTLIGPFVSSLSCRRALQQAAPAKAGATPDPKAAPVKAAPEAAPKAGPKPAAPAKPATPEAGPKTGAKPATPEAAPKTGAKPATTTPAAPAKGQEAAAGRTAAAGAKTTTTTTQAGQGARPGIGKFDFIEPDRPSAGRRWVHRGHCSLCSCNWLLL